MHHRRFLVFLQALSACLVLHAPLLIAAEFPDRVFHAGQRWTMERSDRQERSVVSDGQRIEQESTVVWQIEFKVRRAGDPAEISATVLQARQKVQGKVGKGVENGMLEKADGFTFLLTVQPTGRIDRLDGHAEFLRKLADGATPMLATAKAAFPEESLRLLLQECLGEGPKSSARSGQQWESTFTEPVSVFGALRTKVKWHWVGSEKQSAKVRGNYSTEYIPPGANNGLIQIEKGQIHSEAAESTAEFDRTTGRLSSFTKTNTLKGRLTVSVQGRRTALEFTTKQHISVRPVPESEPK